MLHVSVARALPAGESMLKVSDDAKVIFERQCCRIADDEFDVNDMTEISRGQERRFIYISLSQLVHFT